MNTLSDQSRPITQAIDRLNAATRIVVLSGAGLSKASGIPTYRDTGGLWKNSDTAGFSHADAYKRDPAGFTRFWKSRREEISKAQPNPAHQALIELLHRRPQTRLVTQNVDGLLQKAGAHEVLELHGSLSRLRCDHCGRQSGPWPAMRCLRCLGLARPDVVMFGEQLNEQVFNRAKEATQQCDVLLVVGTTAEVYPAALLPEMARNWGAGVIVVDTESTILTNVADVFVQGRAEEVLPRIIAGLNFPQGA